MEYRDVIDCREKIKFCLQKRKLDGLSLPHRQSELHDFAVRAEICESPETAKGAIRDGHLSAPLDDWIVERLALHRLRKSWYRDYLPDFKDALRLAQELELAAHLRYRCSKPINVANYICAVEVTAGQTSPGEPVPITAGFEFFVTVGTRPSLGLKSGRLQATIESSEARLTDRLGADDDWKPFERVEIVCRGGDHQPFWQITKEDGPLVESIATAREPLCQLRSAKAGDRVHFHFLVYPLFFAPMHGSYDNDGEELSETKKRLIERIRIEALRGGSETGPEIEDVIVLCSQTVAVTDAGEE